MLSAEHSLFPYYIWLYDAARRGRFSARELLRRFETPREIYKADAKALASLPFLSPRAAEALCEKDLSYARAAAARCAELDLFLLCPDHEDYPAPLSAALSSPPLLYGTGALFPPQQTALAIVGTRRSAQNANRCAYRLGYTLGKCGAVIVSGMARGIDGMAHRGALDGGAHTVAVLGCGLDLCYPKEHRDLFEQIKKQGLLLSPFPPGTPALPRNFPARNRIISGLCAATIVVQAPLQSGAVVTAQNALEQNRLLYAFPGAVDDETYAGNLSLLRSGARVITCAEDLLADFERSGASPFFKNRIELDDFYDRYAPLPASADSALPRQAEDFTALLRAMDTAQTKTASAPSDTPLSMPRMRQFAPQDAFIRNDACAQANEMPAQTKEKDSLPAPQRVLHALGKHGATPEELCEHLSLSLSEIELILLQLELDGLVRVSAGERYFSL